jgi:hypothetical protein
MLNSLVWEMARRNVNPLAIPKTFSSGLPPGPLVTSTFRKPGDVDHIDPHTVYHFLKPLRLY